MTQHPNFYRFTLLFICLLAFAWTAMLTGCSKPEENFNTAQTAPAQVAEVNDTDLTFNIKAALLSDESIKQFDVTVATLKGDARLGGVIDTQTQIDKIVQIARSVTGVHSIHNELTLKK